MLQGVGGRQSGVKGLQALDSVRYCGWMSIIGRGICLDVMWHCVTVTNNLMTFIYDSASCNEAGLQLEQYEKEAVNLSMIFLQNHSDGWWLDRRGKGS